MFLKKLYNNIINNLEQKKRMNTIKQFIYKLRAFVACLLHSLKLVLLFYKKIVLYVKKALKYINDKKTSSMAWIKFQRKEWPLYKIIEFILEKIMIVVMETVIIVINIVNKILRKLWGAIGTVCWPFWIFFRKIYFRFAIKYRVCIQLSEKEITYIRKYWKDRYVQQHIWYYTKIFDSGRLLSRIPIILNRYEPGPGFEVTSNYTIHWRDPRGYYFERNTVIEKARWLDVESFVVVGSYLAPGSYVDQDDARENIRSAGLYLTREVCVKKGAYIEKGSCLREGSFFIPGEYIKPPICVS